MKDDNTQEAAETTHVYKIDEGGEAIPEEAEKSVKQAAEEASEIINKVSDTLENKDFKELIKRKAEKENKEEIKRLLNKIGERYMQLHGQERLNPTGRDRLGKNAQYYHDIHTGIANNTLFKGDTDKQLELLRILASPESEVTGAERLIRDLAEFEYRMRKQG